MKREDHAVAAKEELRSRVLRKDDPVLLSVIEKYPVGTISYDCNNRAGSRQINQSHKWNEEQEVWEAHTESMDNDRIEIAPKKQKQTWLYGICNNNGNRSKWFSVFDGMVCDYQTRLKCKATGAAGGRKKKIRA